MIGGEAVPLGELWRTGANEPATIRTTVPIRFSEISLEPGSYAFYTEPGPDRWELFVTRSTGHWGNEITPEVRAQEIGSVTLPRERPSEHVETFTIRFEPESDRAAAMILEWEEFRVTVHVEAGGA